MGGDQRDRVFTLCHLLQADRAFSWDWPPAAALFENLTKMPSSPSPVFRFGLHSRRFIFNTIHYLFLKFQSLFGSLETE